MSRRPALLIATLLPGLSPAAPAFDCATVEKGSIEERICQSPELSKLDRQLAEVFRQASAKAVNQHPPRLKAEQRGWIKGRNDCWKADDKDACIRDSYRLRIAELQAGYRLLPGKGPLNYTCDGQPAKDVSATFFPTDPPSAAVVFGDETSLMFQQQAGGDAKYLGRNESLREREGEATVTWGYGAPEMHCKLRSAGN